MSLWFLEFILGKFDKHEFDFCLKENMMDSTPRHVTVHLVISKRMRREILSRVAKDGADNACQDKKQRRDSDSASFSHDSTYARTFRRIVLST